MCTQNVNVYTKNSEKWPKTAIFRQKCSVNQIYVFINYRVKIYTLV